MPLLDQSYYKSEIPKTYKKDFIHPDFKPYSSIKEFPPLHPSVIPQLINHKKGWNFKLVHPSDPCPVGFNKNDEYGMCIKDYKKVDNSFKLSKPIPELYYLHSIEHLPNYPTINNNIKNNIPLQSTDMRSMDRDSGEWIQFYKSKPSVNTNKYQISSSRYSYL